MKNTKQDSMSAVSRFGRDKRNRVTNAEHIERSPRPRRDADSEGRSTFGRKDAGHRASYNPNFSADNRLKGEQSRSYGERGERRSFGERSERSFRDERQPRGEKPRFGSNRFENAGRSGARQEGFGGKKFGAKKFGEASENQREERSFGGRDFKSRDFGGRSEQSRSGFKGGRKPFRAGDGERSYPKYAAKQMGEVRLNRFLAQSGLCSRREADDFITAGLVTVNGEIVTELGTKVRSTDEVKFNDSKVQGEKKVYLVLNKPKGYVTSLEDPHADKTVMELVKGACSERIYPVGRLDKNSLGLLLFTNDGDITRQLTHPSLEKKKVYQVLLDKPLTRADMELITEGITLEDGEIYADEIAYVGDSKKEVGIEIHSGRNRIVRRIFEHLGYTVQKLDRVYYAGITKKNLKRGQWRFLTREEVDRLKSGRYE
ncbi:MAG: RNA-binding S4 domain-containing protein [Alistipes sp.]|nr:RNA-binding S4 domain-containing protein [Alistipes sp.]